MVEAAKPKRGQAGWREVADGGSRGLKLRISAKGEKVWAVRVMVDGERHRHIIGSYPAVSLMEARRLAEEYVAARRQGVSEREHEARQRAERMTVADAHAAYMAAVGPALRGQTPTLKRQMFERHIRPVIGRRKLTAIRRADIVETVDAVKAKGLPVQANRVFSELMAMLRWAYERDMISGVPAFQPQSQKKPGGIKTKERPRDRTLTERELAAVWRATDRVGDVSGDFLRLVILTGQRRDEVRQMRWEHINWAERLWSIPASEYKVNRDHVVPLSDPAVEILERRYMGWDGSYVLPSRSDEDTAFNGALSALRRARKVAGVADFTLHDLRRTLRTGLSRLGVDRDVAELVIGHRRQGIRDVYDRYEFLEERRAALEAWARHVQTLAGDSGANVVSIAGARA
jgi:integrase